MKKFFLSSIVILVSSTVLTCVYSLIDFELTGWFSNKLQFTMIPGFICIVISAIMFQSGSVYQRNGLYQEAQLFEQMQRDQLEAVKEVDSTFPVILSLLSSGIILIVFSFLIGKQ